MEVVVIASGSSGNSALIRSGEASLLVDVGVSALQIRKRLEVFGRSEGELTAILLTHEHSDHVRGLEVLLKRRAVPVWATAGTWSGVGTRAEAGGELSSGRSLEFGQLRVTPVATSHDAREPVALLVDDGRYRIGFCTDTGVFTSLLLQRMAGCDALFIEANHDADMVRNGPYPWPLKQRIRSRLGHLGKALRVGRRQLDDEVVRCDPFATDADRPVGVHLPDQSPTELDRLQAAAEDAGEGALDESLQTSLETAQCHGPTIGRSVPRRAPSPQRLPRTRSWLGVDASNVC